MAKIVQSCPVIVTDLDYLGGETPVLTALTGTPGTGKSSITSLLKERGFAVCNLNDLVEESGARTTYDEERQTWNVDVKLLRGSIPAVRPLILVGHYSHLLPVDIVIVTRCHPDVLRRRLEDRGWNQRKVQENVEAEALGVITAEAMDKSNVFEIDTTSASPAESCKAFVNILQGGGDPYRAGTIDWSEVIMDWF